MGERRGELFISKFNMGGLAFHSFALPFILVLEEFCMLPSSDFKRRTFKVFAR